MSFKNIDFINKGKRNIKIDYNNRVIESYGSLSERKNKGVISLPLKNEKKIHFRLLSPIEPKFTSIKNIKNEKTIKLINRINSFRKIYFDNNLNQEILIKEIRTLKKENNFFSKYYEKFKEKMGEKKNQYFSDIKKEYEKRKYFVPPLRYNKNIFKDNLLLCNDKKLEDYILHDKGSKKSNEKSLLFLEKIKNVFKPKNKISQVKPLIEIYRNPTLRHNYNTDKIITEKNREIKKSKSEIKKVKNTINLINEIDFFFNSDNKQYLNKLKLEDFGENFPQLSTRINSANALFENIHFINSESKNRNINSKKYLDNLNTENTNETNNSNNIIKTCVSHSKTDKNITRFYNSINIEGDTERIDNTKIIRDINKDNSLKSNINRDNLKKNKTVKFNKEYLKNIERLYEKISEKGNDNKLKFNEQIKKYIIKHNDNFSFEEHKNLSPYNLSKKIEEIRKKIFNTKYIQNSIYLRKKSVESLDNVNKLKKRNSILKDNIIKIEEKMINNYYDINNVGTN